VPGVRLIISCYTRVALLGHPRVHSRLGYILYATEGRRALNLMADGNRAHTERMATQGVRRVQGLGELYEEDYQKAAGFAAEDADEPLRQEVGSVCSSLLGLSFDVRK